MKYLKSIILNYGAIFSDANFRDNLVCVIENSFFDEVNYVYSKDELNALVSDETGRHMTYLVYPYAKELAE